MVVVFPLLGRAMGLSDMAYGLWAGTAVNDTSSVVAAGYAFSEGAGDFATMVKLTRTLAIIPTVLVFAAISVHLQEKGPPRKAATMASKGQYEVGVPVVHPRFCNVHSVQRRRHSLPASLHDAQEYPASS